MEAVFEFGSMSAEVKDIIKKAVGDGKEHERKELVSIIEREVKDKSRLTPGIIAGALKTMCANQDVEVVRRGVYKLGRPIGKVDLRQQVENILIRVQRELDKVCTVNALHLEDADIDFLKKVKGISDSLEADIWNLIDERDSMVMAGENQESTNMEPAKEMVGMDQVAVMQDVKPEPKENDKPEPSKLEKLADKKPETQVEPKDGIKVADKLEPKEKVKPEPKVSGKSDAKQQVKSDAKPENKKA